MGVALAFVLRFDARGMPVGGMEPIFEFVPKEGFRPKPIESGPQGQKVILILFGTGMRGLTGAVSATINGDVVAVNRPVPHAFLIGLDQARRFVHVRSSPAVRSTGC